MCRGARLSFTASSQYTILAKFQDSRSPLVQSFINTSTDQKNGRRITLEIICAIPTLANCVQTTDVHKTVYRQMYTQVTI